MIDKKLKLGINIAVILVAIFAVLYGALLLDTSSYYVFAFTLLSIGVIALILSVTILFTHIVEPE